VLVVVAYRLGGARAAAIVAVPATLLTAGVGVAVVRLGWHYPTDAIGGAALGVGVVCGTYVALLAASGKNRTN
jgi:membrane-associated phospholipid phosphatase